MENKDWLNHWSKATYQLTALIIIALVLFLVQAWYLVYPPAAPKQDFSDHPFLQVPASAVPSVAVSAVWKAPDISNIPANESGDSIRYGRELIANTAAYFGPNGSLGHTSNGMNCQNCHLDAGTRPWGNNYGAVWST